MLGVKKSQAGFGHKVYIRIKMRKFVYFQIRKISEYYPISSFFLATFNLLYDF